MQKNIDDIYALVLLGMTGTLLLSSGIIIFYLRYKRRFYVQREQIYQADLNYQVQLLNSTILSQENERRRIGRDLHDEVGGAMANLRLVINAMAKRKDINFVKTDAEHCQALTDSIIDTVRRIAHNLSPSGLELFGLDTILKNLCEQTRQSSGLKIIYKTSGDSDLKQLSSDASVAMYRIIQELLTNTIKHAEAKQIVILFSKKEGSLILEYSDDGKGIDPEVMSKSKGIGIHNIESRLNMISAIGNINYEQKGFSIRIAIPVPLPAKDSDDE
jgi:signal transduction histidine kinase